MVSIKDGRVGETDANNTLEGPERRTTKGRRGRDSRLSSDRRWKMKDPGVKLGGKEGGEGGEAGPEAEGRRTERWK